MVIPLECPSCGTELRIDSEDSAAICSHCGKPFVVKDAIVQNYIKIVTDTEDSDCKALSLEEFRTDGDVLLRYSGTSPDVVVPDNITVIGKKAFEDCKELVEISLPDSVKIIEENAFAGCDNLRTINFPDTMQRIDSYAFSECSGLNSLILPHFVEEIGPYAFSGCYMLGPVKMPSSRSKIHETAFTGDKDVLFDWPEDWTSKQLDKLKIAAPTQGGTLGIFDADGEVDSTGEPLLFLGISGFGMFVESSKYNFYTYHGFMNLFSIEKNNHDPYTLRTSVDIARQRYEDVADIQKSYSELITLLDHAGIKRSIVKSINIPHFIWKQGKRLNDYKIVDIGAVPVLQITLIQ